MEITKLTVNLPTNLINDLKEQAHSKGVSVTELIRRGLETDLFLTKEEKSGSKLLLEKPDKQVVQLVRK